MTHAVRRTFPIVLILMLLAAFGLAQAAPMAARAAATVPVYDSIPAVYPGHFVSLPFEAEQTNEFGDYLALGGTDRSLQNVVVGFENWACENDYFPNEGEGEGDWTPSDPEFLCLTTPGSSYEHPITVTLYQVPANPDTAGTLPGAVIASITDDVTVPFRPSVDQVNCDNGQWFDTVTETCVDGLAFNWTFDFSALGITLPDQVLVAVTYNTEHFGLDPIGFDGPYNSLNVAYANDPATVGTNVNPDVMFWNTDDATGYTDGGASGVSVLRSDDGWGSLDLVLQINALAPALPATGPQNSPLLIGSALLLLLAGGVFVTMVRVRRA
jgi:LPXTG-motif cell wall-anchored protein